MLTEKPAEKNAFSPQYFIINKSEPQYALIKDQLLDSSDIPTGSSHYFIRAAQDDGCICRIRAGNGTVLFYEILNHCSNGILDEEIREVIRDPSCASPLSGYFHLSPKIKEKLMEFPLLDSCGTWR
jgi:hypothetical protein